MLAGFGTWVDLHGMVSPQSEDQRVGDGAEDLARGKVHAVIHLKVKAS